MPRRVAIADLPASGAVHVEGRAVAPAPLTAPLTGRSCAAWHLVVYARRSGAVRDQRDELGQRVSDAPFFVEDDTGRARVALADDAYVTLTYPATREVEGAPADAALPALLERAGKRLEELRADGWQVECTESIVEAGQRIAILGVVDSEGDPAAAAGYRETALRRVLRAGRESPLNVSVLSDTPLIR